MRTPTSACIRTRDGALLCSVVYFRTKLLTLNIFEQGARYKVLDLGGISNHPKHQIEIINSQRLQTYLIHNFS